MTLGTVLISNAAKRIITGKSTGRTMAIFHFTVPGKEKTSEAIRDVTEDHFEGASKDPKLKRQLQFSKFIGTQPNSFLMIMTFMFW